jgi:hypothetical protein
MPLMRTTERLAADADVLSNTRLGGWTMSCVATFWLGLRLTSGLCRRYTKRPTRTSLTSTAPRGRPKHRGPSRFSNGSPRTKRRCLLSKRSGRYVRTRRFSGALWQMSAGPAVMSLGDGADAAWLLLQHAGAGVRTLDSPANRALRNRCVPLLQEAVTAGLAHPRHLAHTVDGIRAVEGGLPVYAVLSTAFVVDEDGVRLSPGLDVRQIDENRHLVGLVEVSEDLRLRAEGRVPGAVGGDQPEPWPAR